MQVSTTDEPSLLDPSKLYAVMETTLRLSDTQNKDIKKEEW